MASPSQAGQPSGEVPPAGADPPTTLRSVWQQVLPLPVDEAEINRAEANGWTPEFLIQVARLGEHAARCGTGSTRPPLPGARAEPDAQGRTRELVRFGLDLTADGRCPVSAALPWLTVFASAPLTAQLDDLGMIAFTLWVNGSCEALDAWLAVPHPLAPLALAAGLDPDEARTQLGSGAVDEVTLRTLAALRGYQMPPPTDS